MGDAIRVFSGRAFGSEEIELIKETVNAYPKLSQKELAATVCEVIGWTQANGNPKARQCVEFLRVLEGEGEFSLPLMREKKAQAEWRTWKRAQSGMVLELADTSEVVVCGEIELTIARGKDLKLWHAYMTAYHVLGDPPVPGCSMRYMVKSGGRDLACLQFSASALALAARDEWIGWTPESRKAHLHLITNNSRYLVLPWVRVKNLASRTLSAVAKRIRDDWLREYCFAPVLLETFVDTSRYRGTCYKAANWTLLGETAGRGRNDRHTERALTRKAIYVYPLQWDFREVLNGAKPCKVVDPDEF
jgi:hypothetical protein